jgi:hypothetical protein
MASPHASGSQSSPKRTQTGRGTPLGVATSHGPHSAIHSLPACSNGSASHPASSYSGGEFGEAHFTPFRYHMPLFTRSYAGTPSTNTAQLLTETVKDFIESSICNTIANCVWRNVPHDASKFMQFCHTHKKIIFSTKTMTSKAEQTLVSKFGVVFGNVSARSSASVTSQTDDTVEADLVLRTQMNPFSLSVEEGACPTQLMQVTCDSSAAADVRAAAVSTTELPFATPLRAAAKESKEETTSSSSPASVTSVTNKVQHNASNYFVVEVTTAAYSKQESLTRKLKQLERNAAFYVLRAMQKTLPPAAFDALTKENIIANASRYISGVCLSMQCDNPFQFTTAVAHAITSNTALPLLTCVLAGNKVFVYPIPSKELSV